MVADAQGRRASYLTGGVQYFLFDKLSFILDAFCRVTGLPLVA